MFSSIQFKTEFCTQAQATIMPRVTMTQFFLMILGVGACALVFNFPGYLLPIPVIGGYIAGYYHNGELVIKRLRAWVTVWVRQLMQQQTEVTLGSQWNSVELSKGLNRR